MEKSRSWPSAHDWKSCIPQKGIEGSNPSFSAKRKSRYFFEIPGFFYAFTHYSGIYVGNHKFAEEGILRFPLVFPLIDLQRV